MTKAYTWVKCNNNFRGYYVNEYTLDAFIEIVNTLKSNKSAFTIGDRASLIHDSYSLAYVPFNTYQMPSLLTSYLQLYELENVPWRVFTFHINKLATILEHRPSFKNLRVINLIY